MDCGRGSSEHSACSVGSQPRRRRRPDAMAGSHSLWVARQMPNLRRSTRTSPPMGTLVFLDVTRFRPHLPRGLRRRPTAQAAPSGVPMPRTRRFTKLVDAGP